MVNWDVVMAYFKTLFQYLPVKIEEICKKKKTLTVWV